MSSRTLATEAQETIDNKLKEENRSKNRRNLYLWIFVTLICAFAVGTVTVVVLALEGTHTIPEDCDVVLYEKQINGTPVEERVARHIAQIHAVKKHMEWIKKIHVLSSAKNGYDELLGATFVPFQGDVSEAFVHMPKIPGISSHAIFLSDQTLPLRKISPKYFFSVSGPRMFNVFRDKSEEDFFFNYLELPTMPCLFTNMKTLSTCQTWMDLVYREITEEKVVLYNNLHRDIVLVGSIPENGSTQINRLRDSTPHFVTFHVNDQQPQVHQQVAHQLVSDFLAAQFS